ncbi:MAG: Ig-like domain-containing protein [Saprospiraceae bacterium]|nr:Ig-like domain-containing protein [Saprospiraceae bacterium]
MGQRAWSREHGVERIANPKPGTRNKHSLWGSYLASLALLFLACACASISPLQGGAEDETPPQVVSERSTPNMQTRFSQKRIELTFDEWVTLTDVFNQVVISPPLAYQPDITLKGRTVIVELDEREQFRPNATYTINFGAAIKDLTEGNPADELRFVFSTGDFLDSLSVEGLIVDAVTGEPVEKALFMLYDNPADSVVRSESPFYFGRTDKEGRFRIPNVRADTLKGFALLDADLNYRFNQSKEKIGFPDAFIVTSDSSAARNIRIRLFEEARPLRLLDAETTAYGRIKLSYSTAPQRIAFSASDTTLTLQTEALGDSIRIWYDRPETGPWLLFAQADTLKIDTIEIKSATDKAAFSAKATLGLAAPQAGPFTALHPDKAASVAFNHPLVAADTALIFWWEDTLRQRIAPVWAPDSLLLRTWNASWAWTEGLPYEMEALPGAFTDIYGLKNTDTIRLQWRIDQRKSYGTLNLVFENMEPDTDYVVSLLNSTKAEVLSRIVRGDGDNTLRLTPLAPGQFSLRIVIDRNRNGRWDSGLYDTYTQPEDMLFFPLEQLRGNWELETKVDMAPKN